MKTVNYGMNVLNDNGMTAKVYNPQHLNSIMMLVRVSLKNGTQFVSLYQPNTIAKIENETHTFASGMLKDVMIQTVKAKSYTEGKKVFAPKDMVAWIESDQINAIEIIEIDFDERVLLVAQPQDRLPIDLMSRVNIVGYQEFFNLSKDDLEEEYDVVVFSECASAMARQIDQTEAPLKVVFPFGYAHFFKQTPIIKSTLVDASLDDMDSIATYLEYQVNHKSKRRQLPVYHVSIKDLEIDGTHTPEFVEEALCASTSESRFLELYQGEGYDILVIDLNERKVFANDDERQRYINRLFKDGAMITYNVKDEDGNMVTKTDHFYFTMRTKSQGRQQKVFFTTCPPERFIEMREKAFGYVKEGDLVDIMKIEGRVGLNGSSSIKLGSMYHTTTMADFETVVEPSIESYPLELELNESTGLYQIPTLKEAHKKGYKAINVMHTDGGAIFGLAVAIRSTYEYGEISKEQALYVIHKTCTFKRVKPQFEGDLGVEITDCVTMDELKELCEKDEKLNRIIMKIATGIQFRIGEAGKGYAILHDTKSDWEKIVERVNLYNKENDLPQVDWDFDPNMIFLFESARKATSPDTVIYHEELRVCAMNSSINHKKAYNKISNQVFMALNMSHEFIDQLLDAEVKDMKKIFTDLASALEYGHVKGFNAEVSIVTKALSIDPKVARKIMKNKYIQDKELKEVKRRLRELKFGQFSVKAETHYISVDFVGLFNPDKALKGGEAYYADQNGVRKGRVGLFRHPLLNAADKASVKLVGRDDRWYLRNILILNCKDAVLPRMGGADVDGDKVLMIFDKRFLTNFKRYFIIQGVKHEKATRESYSYEVISRKTSKDSDGSNIGGITNSIVRMTDLAQATNFTEVFKGRTLDTLTENINTYSGLSGEFIDQSGIDESQRLIEKDYDHLKTHWNYASYGMDQYLKQAKLDKGYVMDDGNDDVEFFEETSFASSKYVVLDTLNTPLTYVCRRVEALEKECVQWLGSDNSFAEYISDSLPFGKVYAGALDIINETKYYWNTRMHTYHELPELNDAQTEYKRNYYDETIEIVRNIILSTNEDPRLAAAFTFYACYGTGNRVATSQAMPFLTVLDELLDYASQGQRHMYLPFKDHKHVLDGSERVEVIDGALFVNGYFRKRVGYGLASSELTRVGDDWCVQAIRPSETKNFIYTAQLPLRLHHAKGEFNVSTDDNTFYRVIQVKNRLKLQNEAGETVCNIMKKANFQSSYVGVKLHIDEVNYNIPSKKEEDAARNEYNKQFCTVLVTIVEARNGDDAENPYMEFHPTLKESKEGRKASVVSTEEFDYVDASEMLFDDLDDIEYNVGGQDFVNDDHARMVVELQKEFEEERVNHSFLEEDEEIVKPLKGRTAKVKATTEYNEFDMVCYDEEFDF